MNIIQASRGSLKARSASDLDRGELFWVAKNVSANAETGYRSNTSFPYDEGTLYIGMPSLGDSPENPIPIAGARAYKSMVFRGYISSQTSLTDDLFKFARAGDFWIFSNNAVGGDFLKADYRRNDVLLITNADYSLEADIDSGDIGQAKNLAATKLQCSGGDSRNVDYTGDEDLTGITKVSDALDYLNYHKISYKGRIGIGMDYTIESLLTDITSGIGNPAVLTAGSSFIVMQSNLVFNGYQNGTQKKWVSKKGDFVIWQDDKKQWLLVPSGNSEADDITFDSDAAVEEQVNAGTFGEDNGDHIAKTKTLTNVQDALTYLLSHKAMLDSQGKVPISQLHSTVLGAMQYCGTWSPTTSDSGLKDPAYQSSWPVGTVDSTVKGDEETSYNTNNKAGDYYIVSTNLTNVQYYDKTSTKNADGTYSRVIELNNGDWIVFTAETTGKGHWEKIDNSDRISQINFVINGIHNSGEADYADVATVKSLVGTPTIGASDKLVIWDNSETMTVAGVRLIDQYEDDENRKAEDTFMPVYTGNTDTQKRSSIQNMESADVDKYSWSSKKVYITKTNSNVFIGDNSNHFDQYTYGNIYARPYITAKTDNVITRENPKIYFEVKKTNDDGTYISSSLNPDANQVSGAEIFLPDASSKLIGKLAGVTFIKGRLLKSTHDGYADSTSIEEHMSTSDDTFYSDASVVSIEFHSPKIDVNNIETRHITLGQLKYLNSSASNGGSFNNGGFNTEEKTSSLYSHPGQTIAEIINYTPFTSGTLVNDTDLNTLISGKKDRIAIFGEKNTTYGDGEKARSTIIESKIYQASSTIFDLLFHSATDISNATRTLDTDNVSNTDYQNGTDSNFVKNVYGGKDENGSLTGTGTDNNVVVETDTVIGEVTQDDDGKQIIKTPRSLLVSKSLVLGNNNTNSTHVVPGRTLFPDSSQYRNEKTEAQLKNNDVYVEPPSKSGVLLTDNSRVDGGLYI